MSLVVYKAIFGGYDFLPKPPSQALRKFAQFILFTDQDVEIDGWDVRNIFGSDPVMLNRHCKMFPWEYIETDVSVYIDGHVEFGPNFESFLCDIGFQNYEFAAMQHRQEGDIADEFIRNIGNAKVNATQIANVLRSNLKMDLPSVECGLLIRRHCSPRVVSHAHRWWWYFTNICPRDQLSVQSAAFEVGLNLTVLDQKFSNDALFDLVGHKNNILKVISTRISIALRVLLKGSLINR